MLNTSNDIFFIKMCLKLLVILLRDCFMKSNLSYEYQTKHANKHTHTNTHTHKHTLILENRNLKLF